MPDKYKIKYRSPRKPKKEGSIPFEADNYKGQPNETQRFTVGYEFYQQGLCEIDHLPTASLKKTLENYKKFCSCTNVNEIRDSGINTGDVKNANQYKKYFKNLDEDAKVKEFYTSGTSRGFYFIDPTKKIVQIIAHKNSHTPTDKRIR